MLERAGQAVDPETRKTSRAWERRRVGLGNLVRSLLPSLAEAHQRNLHNVVVAPDR
jgi:hypothetical protein